MKGLKTVIQEALLPDEKPYFRNVYVDLRGVLHPTPFDMGNAGLWRFDGQMFYLLKDGDALRSNAGDTQAS